MPETLYWEGVRIVADGGETWDGHRAFVLGHGAGQGMDSPFMQFFRDGLAARGHLVAAFNFPYMEQGRRAPDPPRRLEQTSAGAVAAVLDRFAPRLLIAGGKSMGGRIASIVAAGIPQIRGLAFLGYPLHPPGKPDRLRDAHLADLGRPMLFISGTRDPMARRDRLEAVAARLGPGAALHWIEDGDHSLRRRKGHGWNAALDALDRWSAGLD